MAFSKKDFTDWVLLGEGGQAEVFRARQLVLDRWVAIKRLKLSSIGGPRDIVRFEREAKISASLQHPSLVAIYDYGQDGEFYYLVMEFVEGLNLAHLFFQSELKSLPIALKYHVSRQIIGVVDFIHQQGVLHRDLKPDNFLMDTKGKIKLLDLGMARAQFQSHTENHMELKGTLAYFPPEIFRGQESLTVVSEYYSLALLLLEVYAESRIFAGKSVSEVVGLIQSGINITSLPVPDELKGILLLYLHPNPDMRPSSLQLLNQAFSNGPLLKEKQDLKWLVERSAEYKKHWLGENIARHEKRQQYEAAFLLLKELIEIDPENTSVHYQLAKMSEKLNESHHSSVTKIRTTLARWRRPAPKLWVWFFSVLLALVVIGVVALYTVREPEDLGVSLLARETHNNSQENPRIQKPMNSKNNNARLVLINFPKQYKIRIDHKSFTPAKEMRFPAGQYRLEIMNSSGHKIYDKPIRLKAGEAFEFEFSKKVNHDTDQ